MKKAFAGLLSLLLVLTLLGGCVSGDASGTAGAADTGGTAAPAAVDTYYGVPTDIKATLSIATWDNSSMMLYDSLDLEASFQKVFPNVTLELEEMKDDVEYYNAMKIRASANELPDIMFHLSRNLPNYYEFLLDLSDLDATKNNLLAAGDAINGKIYALPEKRQEEYVLFWPDMFAEAGVEVPDTWGEFVDISVKLQAYYGKDDPNFAAIAMGAKDEWPFYLFSENSPSAMNGNGQYWSEMATQDEPFSQGTDIYKAYSRTVDLIGKGVFGKDPLGMGYDQALSLFLEKKAAMATDSPIGINYIRMDDVDVEGMESFYLPYRDTVDDPFYVPVRGDLMMSATKHSKNPELAKAFVEWYFSPAWYPKYNESQSSASTIASYDKELDPILEAANKYQPDIAIYSYNGGNEDFVALCNETRFDVLKFGAEMFVPGFDLDARLEQLNIAWKAARQKLGIA